MQQMTILFLGIALIGLNFVNFLQNDQICEMQNHLRCLDKGGYSYVAPNDCEKL